MAASMPTLFRLLSARASFLQARHAVLAQNVANADTPRYRPMDLVEPDFSKVLKGQPQAARPVALARTRAEHLASLAGPSTGLHRQRLEGFEVAPSGNAVLIEEQLRRLGNAERGYQLATSLYGKYAGLMRIAIGSGA